MERKHDNFKLEQGNVVAAEFWHQLDDGRIQCDLCPRHCQLQDQQRGLCYVRARHQDQMVLTTYGLSSGYCIDPIEKNRSITFCQAHRFCPLAPPAVI